MIANKRDIDEWDESGFHVIVLDTKAKEQPTVVGTLRLLVNSKGRGGAILMLIWKFSMKFVRINQIQVAFGCASFSGTDVDKHLPILNYLYEHHLAPESLCPSPKVDDYIDLNALFKRDADWNEAKKSIPTLLRGYIKLGAKISDAAIIDKAFNTVYVLKRQKTYLKYFIKVAVGCFLYAVLSMVKCTPAGPRFFSPIMFLILMYLSLAAKSPGILLLNPKWPTGQF